MIVKNEEHHLPGCLASVADLVDEIVVVDTGSTDRTREVAAGYGARVYEFRWVDSFAAARNEALRHATGDWVLWLDADDRLDEANRERLRALFDHLTPELGGYWLKVFSLPTPHSSLSLMIDQPRLFRNVPTLRWHYRIHEQILPSLRAHGARLYPTDIAINHVGYQDATLCKAKWERNHRLLVLQQADDPDDLYTKFYFGAFYLRMGRPGDAVGPLQAVLEKVPAGEHVSRVAYGMLAQAYHETGRYADALTLCRAGLARHPNDVDLVVLECALLRRDGDFDRAETELRLLLEKAPDLSPCPAYAQLSECRLREELAALYCEQGRYAEAEVQARAVLARFGDHLGAQLRLGELFLRQRRWSDLEELLGRLRDYEPAAADRAVLEAQMLLSRDRPHEAKALLEKTIAARPGAAGPRIMLTRVRGAGEPASAAAQELRGVLRLAPRHWESWYALVARLGAQSRWQDALDECCRALDNCPDHPHLLLLYAELLYQLRRHGDAEEALLAVLELQPLARSVQDPGLAVECAARSKLAVLYAEQGRFTEAEGQWRRWLTLQPDSAPALLGLAELYLNQRRWAELEQTAVLLEEKTSRRLEAVFLRARGHWLRGERAEARARLQEALALDPAAVGPKLMLSRMDADQCGDPGGAGADAGSEAPVASPEATRSPGTAGFGSSFWYEGVPVRQPPAVVECFAAFARQENPATIIEIGTYNGGLTRLLANTFPAAKIYTFDILDKPAGLPDRVVFRPGNIFEAIPHVARLIRSPGQTLVLCDGGNKVEEFNTFAPYLKTNDCIMGHDCLTPGWRWVEITEEAIEGAVERNGLAANLQDVMGRAAWLSYKKRPIPGLCG
jgi:tetratricopeptide (TPR) repeat protein